MALFPPLFPSWGSVVNVSDDLIELYGFLSDARYVADVLRRKVSPGSEMADALERVQVQIRDCERTLFEARRADNEQELAS